MALPHFFLEQQVIADENHDVFSLRLSEDDRNHAKVLRLKPGEHLAVVDAALDYFECAVVSLDQGDLTVRIAQRLEQPIRPRVVLAQGLAKGDKMDVIFRHATELGIVGFIPLLTSRSIVKLDENKIEKRMQRWGAIIKSAAMQSGQAQLPELSTPVGLADLAPICSGATAVVICWEEAPLSQTLSQALGAALSAQSMPPEDARIVVVIGPEGGLTTQEVTQLCSYNKYSYLVSLGPSVLRTETAGIVAPALVLYELERI